MAAESRIAGKIMSDRCSYKECGEGGLTDTMGRVEISAVLPSKDKLRKIRSNFLVSWENSGEARFHPTCWDVLIKSARSRKKQKNGMIVTEKAMLKEAAETVERHDSEEEMTEKALEVAQLIKATKYCVCFTGAGISTSAGIGDYRGKSGKWTMEDKAGVDFDRLASREEDMGCSPAKRRRFSTQESTEEDGGEEGDEGVPYEKLRPTYTHEALVKLMDLGHLKYVISQNGDGLHTLSGIPADKISELHGNVFQEKCEKCETRFNRSSYVMDDHASLYFEELEDNGKTDIIKPKNAKQCQKCGLSHRTGRRCSKKGCKGFLMDTIINFRDNLEDSIFDPARDNAERSDLMLCLGTTLTVTPANELVEMGQLPLRLIICNRQTTDLDKECEKPDKKTKKPLGCRVFGDCDRLMQNVMSHILSAEQLKEWEEARPARMKEYDSHREQVN